MKIYNIYIFLLFVLLIKTFDVGDEENEEP